jgi:TonB-dependent SusC/RagA subfamily outer membrane receptor
VQVFPAAGGGIEVRIRGATSINGSNEPLFVVDGYPLPSGTGGLLALNPSDVARIEVLKTAGEIAEYGVRGANGVVRVYTKRGR